MRYPTPVKAPFRSIMRHMKTGKFRAFEEGSPNPVYLAPWRETKREAMEDLQAPREQNQQEVSIRFGERVKELRLEHKLTQMEMATRFGLDRSYLSDLERGRKSISLAMIEVVAMGFEISLSELFRGL